MHHNWIYKCGICGSEIEVEAGYGAGQCPCGGRFQQFGESYDQEFVDQERYYREQDEEYERRHRY